MDRVLRVVGPGVVGVSVAVGAWAAYRLWSDIGRDRLHKPTPILVGRLTTP